MRFENFSGFISAVFYSNQSFKITGMLIFISSVLYCLFGTVFTGIVLCAVAFATACEELVIIIKSEKLNREPKGGFWRAIYREILATIALYEVLKRVPIVRCLVLGVKKQ